LSRNYGKVPCIPLDEMAQSFRWQRNTETIEAAVSRFDRQENRTITDRQVSGILESLLNTYFFNDATVTCQTGREQKGFALIDEAIREELADLDRQDIATALGTVYRSVRRRTAGNREYLDFIRQFVYDEKEKNFRPLPESFINNLAR
jgi:beta-phosphoglucomutase-like phosphatase (HAD superfamily)